MRVCSYPENYLMSGCFWGCIERGGSKKMIYQKIDVIAHRGPPIDVRNE